MKERLRWMQSDAKQPKIGVIGNLWKVSTALKLREQ